MSLVFVVVHLAWATRSRVCILRPEHDQEVGALFNEGARRAESKLLAVGCSVDHVHVVARLSARACVSELARRMKGFSSHELNRARVFPHGLWWQTGYFAESVGPSDLERILSYVRSQREHHDSSHPMEAWLQEPERSG
jgi:REP element-mobilizing transposase RayT